MWRRAGAERDRWALLVGVAVNLVGGCQAKSVALHKANTRRNHTAELSVDEADFFVVGLHFCVDVYCCG